MARKYPGKLAKVITDHYARKPPAYEFNKLHRWLLDLEEIIGERYPHAKANAAERNQQ